MGPVFFSPGGDYSPGAAEKDCSPCRVRRAGHRNLRDKAMPSHSTARRLAGAFIATSLLLALVLCAAPRAARAGQDGAWAQAAGRVPRCAPLPVAPGTLVADSGDAASKSPDTKAGRGEVGRKAAKKPRTVARKDKKPVKPAAGDPSPNAARGGGRVVIGEGSSDQRAAWSFGGHSVSREAGGIDGRTLHERALRGATVERGQPQPQGQEKKENPFLFGGSSGQDGRQSGMAVSVDTENQGWSARHDALDEDIPLESNHRVSAFAGVKDGDVSFGMGPQLIIRDTQQTREFMGKLEDQPDVQPGVGMRMQIDF